MKPNSLSQYIVGRTLPGIKLRERLAAKGCDIGYVMTGRRGDVAADGGPVRIYYDMPEHLTPEHADQFKRVLERLAEVSRNDTKAADKILIMIDTMYGGEEDEIDTDEPPRKMPRFDGDIDENRIHKERLKKRAQKHVAG
jgi:hypothetical protein